MTLLLDTSLWIDVTRARSPAALKQFIAPFVLDPAAHLAEPVRFGLPDPLFARLKAQTSDQGLFSTVTALGLVRVVSFDRDCERFAGLQRLSLP